MPQDLKDRWLLKLTHLSTVALSMLNRELIYQTNLNEHEASREKLTNDWATLNSFRDEVNEQKAILNDRAESLAERERQLKEAVQNLKACQGTLDSTHDLPTATTNKYHDMQNEINNEVSQRTTRVALREGIVAAQKAEQSTRTTNSTLENRISIFGTNVCSVVRPDSRLRKSIWMLERPKSETKRSGKMPEKPDLRPEKATA